VIWCEYTGGQINSADPHKNNGSQNGEESRDNRETPHPCITGVIFQFPCRQGERNKRKNEKHMPNGPVNPWTIKTLPPIQQATNTIRK